MTMNGETTTELATRTVEAPGVALGRAWLMPPKTLAEAMTAAELLAKSSFVPETFRNKPGDVLCAIQFGAEVGLPPLQALQGIAVVNGRPSLFGDAAMAVVQASGLLEDKDEHFEGEGTALAAVCRLKRKGRPDYCVRHFSVADAKAANLWEKAGPWKQYPKRMLQMRARAWAIRDEFADVIKGLSVREEVQDIDVTPERPARGPIALPREIGAPVATAPAPGEAADEPDADALIDETERRRLFVECAKVGKDHEALKAHLATLAIDSTKAIPKSRFPEVLAWTQEPVAA